MQVFKNRPLALAICLFVLTALAAFKTPLKIKLWGMILFIFLAVIGILLYNLKRKWQKRLSQIILCCLFAALALIQSLLYFDVLVKRFEERDGERITVEGYVDEVLTSGANGSRFSVKLREIDGQRTFSNVLLETDYPSALQRGDSFRLTGTARRLADTLLYPEKTVLSADGYVGAVTCEDYLDCTVLERRQGSLLLWVRDVRDVLSQRIEQAVGGEEGNLAVAVFLGDRSGLSGDTVLAFERGGISHLLALSGMHVSILILSLEFLLQRCRVRKQIRAITVPSVAVGYLFLTGCAASTQRAVLMICVLYLSYIVLADYDSFTALCVALFLILFSAPYAISDVSMWMSFVASAGIVIFVPAVSEWLENRFKKSYLSKAVQKTVKGVVTALAVGAFANAAILPLSAYFFGSASLFSVVLTLVLSPVMGAALILSALSLAVPWCTPILFLSRVVLRALLQGAYRVSEIQNALVLLNGEITVALIVLLSVLLILFAVIYLKRRGWLLLPVGLSVVILGIAWSDGIPTNGELTVTYLRREYEEALVISRGKTAVAVDLSSGSASMGRKIGQSVLESGCTELEELILTHYHPQTAGMIASLSSDIKIRALRLPLCSGEKETAIADRLEQEAEIHGISVRYGTDQVAIDGMELRRLDRISKETAIEVPVLLSLKLGEQNLVYLGGNVLNSDLQAAAESEAGAAHVLILGTHGATKQPSESFYTRLQDVEYVIFGNEILFKSCPMALLPREYCVGAESKRLQIRIS